MNNENYKAAIIEISSNDVLSTQKQPKFYQITIIKNYEERSGSWAPGIYLAHSLDCHDHN